MKIGIPTETLPNEFRVAVTPATTERLRDLGHEVLIQSSAGLNAMFPDDQYVRAGATLVDADTAWRADVVLKVCAPSDAEIPLLRPGTVLIGMLEPRRYGARMRAVAATGATAFAMDLIRPIRGAEAMDALSSQWTIVGYRAMLIAAGSSRKVFPGLPTPAGELRAATVLVLGVGAAGLRAVITARQLGAEVLAYDVMPGAQRKVQSVGGVFLELGTGTGGDFGSLTEDQQRRLRALLAPAVADADVVITTAFVPAGPPPVLVSAEAVGRMSPGAVVVDVAGGNCELTQAGSRVDHQGVTILSPANMFTNLAPEASVLYALNVFELVAAMTARSKLIVDRGDEIIASALVTHAGRIVHPDVLADAGK